MGAQWASNNTKMPILGRFISNADSSSIFEYLNYRLRPKLTESLWELSQSINAPTSVYMKYIYLHIDNLSPIEPPY